MGPITIFDKSALQSFSMDEAVWFDSFTMGNVTPLFYVETLADLEKSVKSGKTPEEVVGMLAHKTPHHAVPNVHHRLLIEAELIEGKLEGMDGTGRPILAGATPKKNADGSYSIHFDEFPEAAALNRWQDGSFLEIERGVAKEWRSSLVSQDNVTQIGKVKYIFPSGLKISNLEQLKEEIDKFCDSNDEHVIRLALDIVGVHPKAQPMIMKKWEEKGKPTLGEFAPYVTHVFKVDLLYYQGIDRSLISGARASNKVDMAYLYYLPFSMVFVSGDNLHEKTVPLFLRDDQSFVKASEMKLALKEFDEYFDSLPPEIKALGVYRIAGYPPAHMHNAITDIWDNTMRPDWRKISADEQEERFKPRKQDQEDKKFVETAKKLHADSSNIKDGEHLPTVDEASQVFLKRTMRVHKGKWRMISIEQEETIKASESEKK